MSSVTTRQSWPLSTSATFASAERDSTAPVGLQGLLSTTARVLGVVVDERGQPIREYYLRAFTNDTFTEHAESIASPDGAFVLEGISPGAVSLVAMVERAHGEAPVTLAPGQQLDGVRIVVQRPVLPSSGAN